MGKSTLKEYFSFSKKERTAVIILIIIIAFSIAAPYFFAKSYKPITVDQNLEAFLTTKQQQSESKFNNDDSVNSTEQNKLQLFYFDPNTLDSAGWKKLGLRDKTIQTILHYRSKGGHFKNAEDIRKIYGLRKSDADALVPYIKIANSNTQKNTTTAVQLPASKKININAATAEDFKNLPGIDDALSNRIIKFRTVMHGFTSIYDIKKTYGLPDSTFQKIRPYLFLPDSSKH